jgi:SAM-dependent methyltransferase
LTAATSSRRPRRADVATTYDLGVEAYATLWSPVILPPARQVVAALGLEDGARVLDIGTGSGALVPSIRGAGADVVVVGLDASLEMLRAARGATESSRTSAGSPAGRGSGTGLRACRSTSPTAWRRCSATTPIEIWPDFHQGCDRDPSAVRRLGEAGACRSSALRVP